MVCNVGGDRVAKRSAVQSNEVYESESPEGECVPLIKGVNIFRGNEWDQCIDKTPPRQLAAGQAETGNKALCLLALST